MQRRHECAAGATVLVSFVGAIALLVPLTFGVLGTETPHAAAAVTSVSSAGSGAWSVASTWSGGRVPAPNQKVVIPPGHQVVLAVDAQIAGADVQGKLVFGASRSVSLTSNRNVIVTGELVMSPRAAQLVHRLEFAGFDETKFVGGGMDPVDTDVGLWVMGAGKLTASGSPKTGWTRTAGAVAAGSTAGLSLAEAPTGWRRGDAVFIAPTEPPTP